MIKSNDIFEALIASLPSSSFQHLQDAIVQLRIVISKKFLVAEVNPRPKAEGKTVVAQESLDKAF